MKNWTMRTTGSNFFEREILYRVNIYYITRSGFFTYSENLLPFIYIFFFSRNDMRSGAVFRKS